jgi:hypothetical protein
VGKGNGIYINIILCPFHGQVFGEVDDCTFTGIIGNRVYDIGTPYPKDEMEVTLMIFPLFV